MSQHDYNIANAPGATVRSDINSVLPAILSLNSGPTEPVVTTAYMRWIDATTNTEKQRNNTDSDWNILHELVTSGVIHKDYTGANIPSAATVDLANATGKTVTVTGNVSISSFGVVDAGFNFTIVFAGSPSIIHNVVSQILPGGANIDAKPGDVMPLVSLGGGNWRATNFMRADGTSVVIPAFRGALVYKSANQSIGGGSLITLTWNLEVFDTSDIHDNSVNNSRLTVPTGVTVVRLTGNVTWASAITVSSAKEILLRKNGSDVIGGFADRIEDSTSIGGNPPQQNGVSSPLGVVGGDYFEFIVRQGSDFPGSVSANSGIGTWFSMEVVE